MFCRCYFCNKVTLNLAVWMTISIHTAILSNQINKSTLCYYRAALARLQLFEEVVAFVVYEDEGGEILYFDFPDGLHTKFGILYALDALDIVLSKNCGRTTD